MVKSKNEKKITAQNKKTKKFNLKELDKPNLYKDIFPYSEVSKIVFDNKLFRCVRLKKLLSQTQLFETDNSPVLLIQLNKLLKYFNDEQVGRPQWSHPSIGILPLQ